MSIKLENGTKMPNGSQTQSQSTVLINQAIPTSSHIVLSPHESDAPVYVQYVMPSESVIVSGNSDTCMDHDDFGSMTNAIDTTVSAVSTSLQDQNPVMPQHMTANPTVILKYNYLKNPMQEDEEKKTMKKQRQAEAARLRYHRLDADEKKALNLKRTQAQRRKRQREKEMQELEAILRESNDIVDDPEMTNQLREKRLRARWAEAARSRYQRMTEEERRAHNIKRRLRQMTVKNENGDEYDDNGVVKDKMREQNSKKALAARTRYHRMSPDEKKAYNQKRTEAFRRRRLEEEALLAMPIGRINGEALDRAQQIVVRNAKRAEAARLRYQRMTPEERRLYNQKRYTPKKRRENLSKNRKNTAVNRNAPVLDGQINVDNMDDHGQDSLSTLEREVMRRTLHAQQIVRERTLLATNAVGSKPDFNTFPGHAPVLNGGKRTIIKPKKSSTLANTIVLMTAPPQSSHHST